MRIIHAADLHLGSRFHRIADEGKRVLLSADLNGSFKKLVDYAVKEDIRAILLSGDVFDKDSVLKKDKEYFYSVIREHPDISFYYLRGNHDSNDRYTEALPNLFLFQSEGGPKTYFLQNGAVAISGFEIGKDDESLYRCRPFPKTSFNILMLHGDVSKKVGKDSIDISRLEDKNVDYFALGHIHAGYAKSLLGESVLAYPGCLMGRGYDEEGPKGFYVLSTERGALPEFVHIPNREFKVLHVSCDAFKSIYDIQKAVEDAAPASQNIILEAVLEGRISFEPDVEELKSLLSDDYFQVDVKDETSWRVDSKELDERSLAGLFVKAVREDPSLSDEEKDRILRIGLRCIEKETK